ESDSSCTMQLARKTSRLTSSPSCTPSESLIASCPGSFLFPPQVRKYVAELMRSESLEERVRPRPGRHYPRGVKRKMSNYNVVTTISRRNNSVIDPKPRRIRLT